MSNVTQSRAQPSPVVRAMMQPPSSVNRAPQEPSAMLGTGATSPNLNQPSVLQHSRVVQVPRATATIGHPSIKDGWPEEAKNFLRRLIARRAFFAAPVTPEDRKTLADLYCEFQQGFGLSFLNVPADDARLPALFELKVMELQIALGKKMYGTTQENRIDPTAQIPASTSTGDGLSSTTTISTPTRTPIIPPSPRQINNLGPWTTSDADMQSQIFRHILRTAKDPARLKVELDQYCSELGRKDQESATSEAVRRSVESLQAATPSDTSPAGDAGDLDTMIKTKLRVARQKRQREMEMQKGRGAGENMTEGERVKRVRMESLMPP